MSLIMDFPPPPKTRALSEVEPLTVVRDPLTNNRYLTLAQEEEEWDDGTDQQSKNEPIKVVVLHSGEHPTRASFKSGVVVELPIETRVIVENAEIKILEGNQLIGTKYELNSDEINAIRRGRKIEAIKLIRARWGLSLKEAKDLADNAEKFL